MQPLKILSRKNDTGSNSSGGSIPVHEIWNVDGVFFFLKSSDQSVTDSTTLVDCSELSFEALPNTKYLVAFDLILGSATAAGDLSAKVALPSGSAYGKWSAFNDATSTSLLANIATVTTQTTIFTSSSAFQISLPVRFVAAIGASGGVAKLQFAQATQSAGFSAIIKAGSCLRARLVE